MKLNRRNAAALAAFSLCMLGSAAVPAAAQNASPDTGGAKFPLPAPGTSSAPGGAGMVGPDAPAAGVTGAIAVKAVQGTPGGPAIANAPITVQLIHRGAVIKTIEAELDEHGVAVLEDLPIGMGVTPVVHVTYGKVGYQQPGEIMNAEARQQTIEVVCYELSSEAPDWHIAMRHVMVGRDPQGLTVAEVIVIDNPENRTWTGTPVESGQPVTCVLPLPEGATNVALGRGFHDWCCTTFESGKLSNHLPLMPQRSELHFRYTIPVVDGGALLRIPIEQAVAEMMVVVPEELATEGVEGLDLGGTETFGGRTVRYYRSSDVEAGRPMEVRLAGLTHDHEPGAASGASIIRTVGGIGAGLLVLITAIVLMRRPAPGAAN